MLNKNQIKYIVESINGNNYLIKNTTNGCLSWIRKNDLQKYQLFESIEHMSSWRDNNGEEVVFTILKNPTKKEFRDLLNHSKYKQLRGLCSVNADSDLYVWDASYGTHDTVFQKYIMKNEKNWDGNYVNIMFRPKDYDIWGFTLSDWIERLGYKETDNSTNSIPSSKLKDVFDDDDDDLGLLDESVQFRSN